MGGGHHMPYSLGLHNVVYVQTHKKKHIFKGTENFLILFPLLPIINFEIYYYGTCTTNVLTYY